MTGSKVVNSSSVHVFRVLEFVARSVEPVGVLEVARGCELPNSTAHRALATLEQVGYVGRHNGTARYTSGFQLQQVRHSLLSRFQIRRTAGPLLREIADTSGQGTGLAVRIGWYGLVVVWLHSETESYNVRTTGEFSLLGDSLPGRAMLALETDDSIRDYYAFIEREHPDTLSETTRDELWRDIGRIRERGFAYLELDLHPRSVSLAIPIRSDRGAVAALEIEGPLIPTPSLAEDPRILNYLARVRDLEAQIAEAPDLADAPFSDVTREEIVLKLAP